MKLYKKVFLGIFLVGVLALGSFSFLKNVFATADNAPTVIDPTASMVQQFSASLGANISNVGYPSPMSARGMCWGPTINPTLGAATCFADDEIVGGPFTVNTLNVGYLEPGTVYHYRGYATNPTGTGYSPDATFHTLATPTVTSPTATSINSTSATLGATVNASGYPGLTARGVCYSSTVQTPTTPCVTASGTGTGAYTANVTSLTQNTLYYYRGFATNTAGTGYSPVATFTPTSNITVDITANPTNILYAPGTSIIAWSSTGADACTVSGGGISGSGTSGQTTATGINTATTFTASCHKNTTTPASCSGSYPSTYTECAGTVTTSTCASIPVGKDCHSFLMDECPGNRKGGNDIC